MQPRNYFTDAAEWFLGGNRDPHLMSSDEYRATKNKIEHWVKNGMCFILPVGGILLDETKENDFIDEGLLRPPYPVCILEYVLDEKTNPLRLIVVVETIGDEIHVYMMSCAEKGGWTPPAIRCEGMVGEFTYNIKPHLPWYVHKKEADWPKGRSFKEDAKHMLEALAVSPTYQFLCVINRYHTTFEDVAPPERLNRKRLKRGKVPLFTYKVLTIGKKKRKSANQGGTHASPRSHLRRGYYRTSRNGVRHWVQPCMVKGETDGFVHKDYKVEGTVMEESHVYTN